MQRHLLAFYKFAKYRDSAPLKSYKSKGIDCSQILTAASFAYKQQKRVSEFFISTFFSRVIFVRSIHIFLILFQKCSVTFH